METAGAPLLKQNVLREDLSASPELMQARLWMQEKTGQVISTKYDLEAPLEERTLFIQMENLANRIKTFANPNALRPQGKSVKQLNESLHTLFMGSDSIETFLDKPATSLKRLVFSAPSAVTPGTVISPAAHSENTPSVSTTKPLDVEWTDKAGTSHTGHLPEISEISATSPKVTYVKPEKTSWVKSVTEKTQEAFNRNLHSESPVQKIFSTSMIMLGGFTAMDGLIGAIAPRKDTVVNNQTGQVSHVPKTSLQHSLAELAIGSGTIAAGLLISIPTGGRGR